MAILPHVEVLVLCRRWWLEATHHLKRVVLRSILDTDLVEHVCLIVAIYFVILLGIVLGTLDVVPEEVVACTLADLDFI